MSRYTLPIWTVLVFGLPAIASADWHEFWARFQRDQQRNEAWPLPFNQVDQQSVRSIFGTMVRQGWEQQIVFHDFHFDEKTHELNKLGEQKLLWVLRSVPPERASLFIQSSLDPKVNDARMESLRVAASDIMQGEPAPDVVPSRLAPVLMRGRNADAQIGAAHSLAPATGLSKAKATSASSSN